MRILKFNIDKQMIQKDPSCDFKNIVRGTKGYLQAAFSFSQEWDGMVKMAEFRRYLSDEPIQVPLIHNKCMVPGEVTGSDRWKVRVIGKRGDMILTTSEEEVKQIE